MSFLPSQENRQTSFPELVGRSAQEAGEYITARDLIPIFIKPNQPVSFDYRTNRVHIVTDESGSVVLETPTVG